MSKLSTTAKGKGTTSIESTLIRKPAEPRILSVSVFRKGRNRRVRIDIRFNIQNYVLVADLGEPQNLEALAIGLGLEQTEYEPEQFPGLVFRPASHSCVLLIFASGKTIIAGATSEQEAQKAFRGLVDTIEQYK